MRVDKNEHVFYSGCIRMCFASPPSPPRHMLLFCSRVRIIIAICFVAFHLLCATSKYSNTNTWWCKLIAPKLLSIHCTRRFLEIGPENWHTYSLNTCQPVIVCFSPDMFFCFFCFFGCLGLKRSKNGGEKKPRQRLDRDS